MPTTNWSKCADSPAGPLAPGNFCLSVLGPPQAEEFFAFACLNRKFLQEWLPWARRLCTPEDCRVFLEDAELARSLDRGCLFGVRVDGVLAGAVEIQWIDWTNQNASLGYWLGEAFCGKGIATGAVLRVASFAREELRLHRLEIRTDAENERSARLALRAGFAEEGFLRDCERVESEQGSRWTSHRVFGKIL
jgi:ribosomal-protein-serine acetyltransferase